MAKLVVLFLCIALFAVALACTPPGMHCMADDDCCGTLICNKWAYRCTKPKVIGFNASPQDGQDGGE